jgi:hypothetical protein
MKIRILALLLALTTTALAAMPGAIAPVAFGLAVARENPPTERVLAGGAIESTYTTNRLLINNRAILDEATRLGLMPASAVASNYKGWKIVAAYEEAGILYEFFAYHATSKISVSLEPIVRLEYRPDLLGGSAGTAWGKVTRGAGTIVSGVLTYNEIQYLTIILAGSTYSGSANAITTARWLPALMGQGRSQWVYQVRGGFTVLGSGPETVEGYGRDPMTGRISFGVTRRILDMEALGMW